MARVDWFPRAQSKPITTGIAWEGLKISKQELKYAQGVIDSRKRSIKPVLLKAKQGQQLSKIESRGYYFNWQRLAFDRPSPTVPKNDINLCHPIENRVLTPSECAGLGTFPDMFIFKGAIKEKRERIGNSVPPLMIQAIASRIRELFLDGAKQKMSTSKDYLETLEQAWQQHLAPREPGAPTVISTFAGCGGSSLGYSMAGYRELLAVEWNDNAVETFKLNFPGVPVYHGDIHKLSVEQALEMTGLQPGELDLLDGSPPCQGFSTAGKRKMEDKRNQLYMQFVRLLRGLKPKVFVMENVSGLVRGKMKLIFADIMKELKASGYQVRCKLLNAMYFNVPQSRQRLIFIGVRNDLKVGSSFPGAQGQSLIGSGVAIEGASNQPLGKPTLAVRKIAHKIQPGENAGKYTPNGTAFSVSRLDAKKPSMTVTKHLAGMSGILQPLGHYYLSEHQLKRIGSYPDGFILTGSAIARWACIGNSVPPLMMRAVASHIRTEILTCVMESCK